jgi:hypothetical protein
MLSVLMGARIWKGNLRMVFGTHVEETEHHEHGYSLLRQVSQFVRRQQWERRSRSSELINVVEFIT